MFWNRLICVLTWYFYQKSHNILEWFILMNWIGFWKAFFFISLSLLPSQWGIFLSHPRQKKGLSLLSPQSVRAISRLWLTWRPKKEWDKTSVHVFSWQNKHIKKRNTRYSMNTSGFSVVWVFFPDMQWQRNTMACPDFLTDLLHIS